MCVVWQTWAHKRARLSTVGAEQRVDHITSQVSGLWGWCTEFPPLWQSPAHQITTSDTTALPACTRLCTARPFAVAGGLHGHIRMVATSSRDTEMPMCMKYKAAGHNLASPVGMARHRPHTAVRRACAAVCRRDAGHPRPVLRPHTHTHEMCELTPARVQHQSPCTRSSPRPMPVRMRPRSGHAGAHRNTFTGCRRAAGCQTSAARARRQVWRGWKGGCPQAVASPAVPPCVAHACVARGGAHGDSGYTWRLTRRFRLHIRLPVQQAAPNGLTCTGSATRV